MKKLKKLIKEKNLKPSIIELPPIDLTTAKKNTIGKMSTNPATGNQMLISSEIW